MNQRIFHSSFCRSAASLLSFVCCLVVLGGDTLMAWQSTSDVDWPQWRGANQDGISQETGLLKSWPEDGPKKLWTMNDAGDGYAGFAIVGDSLFTLGANENNEFALCLDANTGAIRWRVDLDERFVNRWGDGPRNTPTVDDGFAYFLSAKGTVCCIDVANGTKKWTRSLVDDFGGSIPQWGYSESVLVDGDKVVCTPGGMAGAMVALNKENGEFIWQSRTFTDPAHYSSIVIAESGGQKHYVQLVEKAVVGIAPDDGRVLWRQEWSGRVAVIPSPIFHDNSIYITSGYGAGSAKFDISDLDSVKKQWFSKSMKNHHGGVILLDSHYFGYSDGAGWICQDANTGDMVWNEKREFGKGAIGYADGRFYLVEEKSGKVALIAASTEGWQEHGRFTLEPQSQNRKPAGAIWVHPVISNGKLYLRDQEIIYCFDVSEN